MVMAIQHGHLHFAYQVGSQTLARLESEGAQSSPVAGIVYACLGSTCYEWNQLEKALSFLSQAIHLSRLSGHTGVLIHSKIFLARVFQAQGDSQAAAYFSARALQIRTLRLQGVHGS